MVSYVKNCLYYDEKTCRDAASSSGGDCVKNPSWWPDKSPPLQVKKLEDTHLEEKDLEGSPAEKKAKDDKH